MTWIYALGWGGACSAATPCQASDALCWSLGCIFHQLAALSAQLPLQGCPCPDALRIKGGAHVWISVRWSPPLPPRTVHQWISLDPSQKAEKHLCQWISKTLTPSGTSWQGWSVRLNPPSLPTGLQEITHCYDEDNEEEEEEGWGAKAIPWLSN